MDGLDKLIAANGDSSATIDNFVAATNFEAELTKIRALRDKVGAHLEIDDARTMQSLLSDIDAEDLGQALSFYQMVAAAFIKTCHSVFYLRMHPANGRRLYSVSPGHAPAVACDSNTSAPASPEPPPINEEEAYNKSLTRWLDGDEEQKGDARQFFWNAFLSSDVVETIEEIELFSRA